VGVGLDTGGERSADAWLGDDVAALVLGDDGSLEELDGPVGVDLTAVHDVLVAYARAFAAVSCESARFCWVGPGAAWHGVRLTADELGRTIVTVRRGRPPFGLTARELDVITLVAGGLSNAAIAARLGSSPRTVTTHLERILVKVDQSNRAGAASVAVEHGLLRVPVPGGSRSLEALAVGRLDARVAGDTAGAAGRVRRPVRRPITVGAAIPLTGFSSSDGHEMLNGTQLAVAELNERGGIGGRRVELMVVDTNILAEHEVATAFHALVEAEVDGITSGYTAAQQTATDIVAAYGCPYLNAATSGTMIDVVRDDPSRYARTFHVCPGGGLYGPGFVRFLNALRDAGQWAPPNRRLAVVANRWPGTDMGVEALLPEAERSGWDVDFVEWVDPDLQDWEPVIRRIRSAEPAAVMLAHFFASATAPFQRAFLREPTNTLIYTLYGPSVPEYLETLGADADGVLWATVTGTYGDAIGGSFARRYAVRYGTAPGRSHAGIAYDRVGILASAWARAGNPRAFDHVAKEIRRAVYRGTNGSYLLDTPGQAGLSYPDTTPDPSIAQAHLVFQVQGGAHRILAPDPYSDGRFRLPPWFH
jgi:branched-chain amino acid transport system substrate-binding protein